MSGRTFLLFQSTALGRRRHISHRSDANQRIASDITQPERSSDTAARFQYRIHSFVNSPLSFVFIVLRLKSFSEWEMQLEAGDRVLRDGFHRIAPSE